MAAVGWQAEMNVFKGINAVSISVPDLGEARRFYRDILERSEPIFNLTNGGTRLRALRRQVGLSILPQRTVGVECWHDE